MQPYQVPTQQKSSAQYLSRLDSLTAGDEFILGSAYVGHVLDEPVPDGKVAVDIPSLPWRGAARGSLQVLRVPRPA